jgi:ankyrin repeat protein
MRLLVDYGADPLIVHRGDHVVDTKGGYEHRIDTTTAIMAATGMGGGVAWAQPERGQREALVLEAVKLAVELGVDVNVANTDGRTALDAAKAAKLQSVESYLVEKGARGKSKD